MDFQILRDEIVGTGYKRLQSYKELTSLAREQHAILTGGLHMELPGNIAAFDPILSELQRLDRDDEDLFRRLWQEQDTVPSADMEEFRAERRAIDLEIRDEASTLQELTKVNARLISVAMQFVNFTMLAIGRTVSGAAGGGRVSVMVDSRA